MRLMLPRMFGVAVVQLNFLVETSLASLLGTGAVSALNYAWRVMLLPQGVVAQSVATAAFPTFADQYSRGQFPQLRSSLAATVRSILFIAIPAAIGLLVLREPIIQLLFERGQFHRNLDGTGRGGVGRVCVGVDRPFGRGDSGARFLCPARHQDARAAGHPVAGHQLDHQPVVDQRAGRDRPGSGQHHRRH